MFERETQFFSLQKNLNLKQHRVLNGSLLYAGICFVFIALLSTLFCHLFKSFESKNVIWSIGVILFFLSSILGMFSFMRLNTKSLVLEILISFLYIMAESFFFGLIFSELLNSKIIDSPFVALAFFSIGGSICILLVFIGYLISLKTAINIAKINWLFFIIILSSLLVSLFLMIFNLINLNIFFIYSIFMIYLSLSLISSISFIKNSTYFTKLDENKDKKMMMKLDFFFGYNILVNFISLMWTLLIFFLRFYK